MVVQEEKATMVIFDNDLSPSQLRVLTEMTGRPGVGPQRPDPGHLCPAGQDREGRFQVELAQYQYPCCPV